MKKICSLFAVIIMLTVGFTTISPSSGYAITLEQAKSQGLIGEQPDGLLGAVKPDASVQSLIKDINQKRLAKYKSIASKNQTPLSQVQALAGKKLIRQTQSGAYIKNAAGKWQKKP